MENTQAKSLTRESIIKYRVANYSMGRKLLPSYMLREKHLM